MKKKILNMAIFGALFFGLGGVTSCGYDDDELQSRITVVEGSLAKINDQLTALQNKGAGVQKAEQDADGNWTLTLSDGTSVAIKTGGATVTVTENDDNFIIKVGDAEYVLPKGASASMLIYSPQYEDGIEIIDDGAVAVQFMMSPALTSTDGLVAEIQEAHELKTRAGSSLFKVTDGVSINGDIITIPIMATEAQEGKTYAVSVVVTQGSKQYISNYFRIKVGANNFKAEELEDYSFSGKVTDAVKGETSLNADGDETWTWKATLPADLVDEFTFADFFTGLPAGVTFEVAAKDKQQSDDAVKAYEVLKNSLSADGKWSLAGRPGCAFPNGFIVNIKQGETVKMKVNWIFNDPLADIDFKGVYAAGIGGHIEIYGATNDGSDMLTAGSHDIDLPKEFSQAADNGGYSLMHDGGRFINQEYTQFEASYKESGDIIYHDGTRYVLGDVGQKYAKFSKGVWWTTHQLSFGSSNRRNLADRPGEEGSEDNIAWCGGKCNGELEQWDGIPGSAYVKFGVSVNEQGHFITTSAYKGWCMRAGIWCKYEYVYGEKEIGGGALVWVWFNRRSCPEGVNDYDVDKNNPDNADLN